MNLFRCKIPECESGASESSFITNWLNSTTPFNKISDLPEKCERFKPISDNYANSCSIDSFNNSWAIKCDEFVYETEEVTILKEVNIMSVLLFS